MTENAAVVEALAAVAHEMWTGWTAWMIEQWDQTLDSGETFQARWQRQMATPYAELSEDEKQSDRREAMRILEAIRKADAWVLTHADLDEELDTAWGALVYSQEEAP